MLKSYLILSVSRPAGSNCPCTLHRSRFSSFRLRRLFPSPPTSRTMRAAQKKIKKEEKEVQPRAKKLIKKLTVPLKESQVRSYFLPLLMFDGKQPKGGVGFIRTTWKRPRDVYAPPSDPAPSRIHPSNQNLAG